MSMHYIRKACGVPAKRGMRIRYTGGKKPKYGKITGSQNSYLRIRLDKEKHSRLYHPTWEIEYIDDAKAGEVKP